MTRILVIAGVFATASWAQLASGLSAELTAYLDLSYARVGSLARLRAGHAEFLRQKDARQAQVLAELSEETKRLTIDPVALGLQHVELEAIRRARIEADRQLRRDSHAVLDATQMARIETLLTAQSWTTVVVEAECYYLLERESVSGDFYIPIFLPTPGCAIAPIGGMSRALRGFFGFTPRQENAIEAGNASVREFAREKQTRARQVQGEIAEETGRVVPDPNALGVRYLELEAIRREVDDREQRARREAGAELVGAQKELARELAASRPLARLAAQADCNYLVDSEAYLFRVGSGCFSIGQIAIPDPLR